MHVGAQFRWGLSPPESRSQGSRGGMAASEARLGPFLSLKTCCPEGTPGFPGGSDGKESTCNAGDQGLIPGSGRFPGEGKWPLTPVFLPEESHGQRNLMGYSPWGCKELDTTK